MKPNRPLTSLALVLLPVLLCPPAARAADDDFGPVLSSVWVNAYDEEMNELIGEGDEAALAGDWAKAAGRYQEAADKAKNQVYRVAPRTYLGIREYLNGRIRGWPAEGLAAYRKIVDPRAGELAAKAFRSRREAPLREVARQYVMSSHGPSALLALGTRALARGDADTALRHLLEILRLYPEGAIPGVAREDVLARAGLAAAKRGDRLLVREMRARAEVLPEPTTVAVAGDPIPIRRFLNRLDVVPAGADAAPGWNTVGGNAARTGGRDGPDGPLRVYWSRPLPRISIPDGESAHSPLLSRSPLIADGQVVVVGPLLVRAWPIEPGPGAPGAWEYPSAETRTPLPADEPLETRNPAFGTAFSGMVAFPFRNPEAEIGSSLWDFGLKKDALALLGLSTEGMLHDLRGDPYLDPIHGERFEDVEFSGAPAVAGGRLYISAKRTGRRAGQRVETLVFAFDLGAEARRLRPRWENVVCEGGGDEVHESFRAPFEKTDASSVSVRNGIVYVCSNTGAVSALDGETGEILWIHTYERARPRSGLHTRSIRPGHTWFHNPPILDHRYLYVAPVDADSLLVFFQLPDLGTGYVLHDRLDRDDVGLGFEPEYLLGVRDGVAFLGGTNRNGAGTPLLAVRAGPERFGENARISEKDRIPWRAEIEEDAPRGRGVVAGGAIYFPTAKGIYRVDPATGTAMRIVDPSDDAVTKTIGGAKVIGNLAVAGPWLVSVSESHVTLFGPAGSKKVGPGRGD